MKAVLAVESLMSKSAVLRQLSEQCRGGTFIAEGVEKKVNKIQGQSIFNHANFYADLGRTLGRRLASVPQQ